MKQIYFLLLLVSAFSAKSNVEFSVDNCLLIKLQKLGFPNESAVNISSINISFEDFSKAFSEKTFDDPEKNMEYFFSSVDFRIGSFIKNILFYSSKERHSDTLYSVYTYELDYLFFNCLNEKRHYLFKDTSGIKEIFNSTELDIITVEIFEEIKKISYDNTSKTDLEFYINYVSGRCYDLVVDLELSFNISILVLIDGKIEKSHESNLLELSEISSSGKKITPILKFETEETFLYTYGVNEQKGKPEIIRYREVYYDINSGKIIKDQLSSEFIYYDVDRH